MPRSSKRIVRAMHGRKRVQSDATDEVGFAAHLRDTYEREGLIELFGRFVQGDGEFEAGMRRIILRALVKRMGNGVRIDSGVGFKHPETFEIGDGVFIGAQAYLQGRHDGRFVIGKGCWLGPQSYFDARDLVLGEHVGWGPGAKVLGSEHTGLPTNVPIIQTDLEIQPVRVGDWADIGTNAVILPGVTIGKGSMVGAGAVVTRDVAPFAVVAGVPARFVRWRKGHERKHGGPE